jgi:hypothetical protein
VHVAKRLRAIALAAAVVCVTVAANAWAATLVGTQGNDVLVGSTADDTLSGLDGNDRLRGRGGDDVLDGGPGSDDIAGGRGTDAATYAESTGVKVSVDDLANDGASGEHDNVQTDVEDVFGSPGADLLSGSAASNTLDGGDGNDELAGGGGRDHLYGGDGNDRITSRDGAADTLDCGAGSDIVIVDELDRDRGCEIVDRRPAVPRVDFTVAYEWVPRAGTVLHMLELHDVAPTRGRLEVRCRGGGCPFAVRRRQVSRTVRLTPLMRRAVLQPGARVEIRLTPPGYIGKLAILRMRTGRPSVRIRCLAPRSNRPRRCPTEG